MKQEKAVEEEAKEEEATEEEATEEEAKEEETTEQKTTEEEAADEESLDDDSVDKVIELDENGDEVEVLPENEIKDEEEIVKEKKKQVVNTDQWQPKTSIGKMVKKGEIKDIDEVLDSSHRIVEPEIVDVLLPEAETELLLIGQSKGKFGGGQRRIFKQTQKKTKEGNKPNFATFAIIGNSDGYIGFGYGKAKETVPSREKAFRRAKLNIMKIRRGCGSWECSCGHPHSIPFKVSGKCSSVKMTLMPASKGTGLCIEPECAKILKLAGIKDIWSKTQGHTKTKLNLIYACIDALKQLANTKVLPKHVEKLSIKEGRLE